MTAKDKQRGGTNAFHKAVENVPTIRAQTEYIMAACTAMIEETPELCKWAEMMATWVNGLSPASAAYLIASIGLYLNERDGNKPLVDPPRS